MCAAQQSEKGEFTPGLWPRRVSLFVATAKAKILHRTGGETFSTVPCLHQPFSATKEKEKALDAMFSKEESNPPRHNSASLLIQPIRTTEC